MPAPSSAQQAEREELEQRYGRTFARGLVDFDAALAPNEEASARWLFRFVYGWFSRMVYLGSRKTLEHEDLWALVADEDPERLFQQFVALKGEGPGRSTRMCMWVLVRQDMLVSLAMMMVFCASQVAQPLLLRQAVHALGSGATYGGLFPALGLPINGVVGSMANHMHLHLAFRSGRRLRSLIITAVYRKALGMSADERAGTANLGQMTNLVATDSQKVYEFFPTINLVWSAPLLIAVSSYFLLHILGWSALVGISFIILFTPLTRKVMGVLQRLRVAHMPFLDRRVKLCSEAIQAIKVTKCFGWEQPFKARIYEARAAELRMLRKELFVWASTLFLTVITPIASVLVTFGLYALSEETLTAADAFSTLCFFTILRFPLNYLGQMLSALSVTWVSFGRISSFLGDADGMDVEPKNSSQDRAEYQPDDAERSSGPSAGVVVLKNASFGVGGAGKAKEGNAGDGHKGLGAGHEKGGFLLRDVTMRAISGQLVAVVGAVGSGKSTLLNAILGEARRISDESTHSIRGSVGYASQTPFILNATMRDNITFGLAYDEHKYERILTCCELWADIETLPGGDRTMIGERGVTLSGGQKQRVSLARLAYRKPDVALFDDPLSALDAHTGKAVFDNLIGPQGYLKDSARILVTHATQYLSQVGKILVLHADGLESTIRWSGSYDEMQAQAAKDGEDFLSHDGGVDLSTRHFAQYLRSLANGDQEAALKLMDGQGDEKEVVSKQSSMKSQLSKKDGTLHAEEEREESRVSWRVVWVWFKAAGGVPFVAVQILLLSLDRATYASLDLWLALWTQAADGEITALGHDMPEATPERAKDYYFVTFVIIGAVNFVAVFLRSEWMALGGVRAARVLFEDVLESVFRSPMLFFETTPLGRITNRLTFDTETIDFVLVQKTTMAVLSWGWFVTSITIMACLTPYTLVCIFPVVYFFYRLQRLWRKTSVDLQRLDSTSRSPVQALFAETLLGADTIRAFGNMDTFISIFDSALRLNTRAVYAFTSSARWLSIRLDALASLVIFSVALAMWLSRNTIDASLAAVSLTWSFVFATALQFLVKESTEAEALFVSVERVLAYSSLAPEGKAMDFAQAPGARRAPDTLRVASKGWPPHGAIEFDQVVLRYRKGLDPALNGLSLSIDAGVRVGVVGRTGAGKSTISTALFRLVEPQSGDIRIDGESILDRPLRDVRGNKMVIIPQDPVLFDASVWYNLDPCLECSEAACWDALEKACLASYIKSLPGMLHFVVGSYGENLSTGQRQLLCIARAFLRRPNVLVMDEATANVDTQTDEAIQDAVAVGFTGCTLIVIAHRLHTVITLDKTLVMCAGQAAEYDAPAALLANPNSSFSKLVDATGPATSVKLRRLAGCEKRTGARVRVADHRQVIEDL